MKGERGSGMTERYRAEGSIKKGPWTAEEDQVLVNFVNKYGPKDWSSLRSMGLLLRTGKSCRLRWVNKLRPNLKAGCKFTAEEERVVIDLQARFGNKWATIATYLPGRTDNDVKNFWSSRQKRLAKLLQNSPSRNKSSHKNKGKAVPMAPHDEVLPPPQEIVFNYCKMEEHPPLPSTSHFCSTSSMVGPQMLPLMPLPDLLPPHPNNKYSTLTDQYNQPNSIAEATLLPLVPDHHDSVFDLFASCQADEFNLSFGSEFQLELLGGERKVDEGEKLETLPDCFFDELPADMFDCLEPNPSSPSNFSN